VTVVADEQILVGTAATITGRFYDQDGDLAEPAGTVTVGVVDEAGATVVAAGTATTTGSTGVRTYTLSASATSEPRVLVASWTTGTVTVTTRVEVVGGFYASVRQVRDSDPVLDDPRKYSSAQIVVARRAVEREFEDYCGVAFVPRYRRVRLDGTGRYELVLPDAELRSVRSVREYDEDNVFEAYTATELAAIPASRAGVAVRTDGEIFERGRSNIVVEYEHGYDRPPADVLEAFMLRVRDVLNRSNRGVPDRATTFTSDVGGTYSLLVAGRGGSITGIPDVDVVLKRYARRIPGIG
jgi:hypothetical protein